MVVKGIKNILRSAAALLCAFDCFGQSIRFESDRVVVDRLEPEVLYTFARYKNNPGVWNEVFTVRVNGAATNIPGSYRVGETMVTFVPEFPFARGVEYEATFYTAELALNANEVYLPPMDPSTLSLNFRVGGSDAAPPAVTSVFPTSNELPENLLRFHIEFSSPMTRGELYDRVHLLNDEGKEVEHAILLVDEELWDEEMKSVTVMLDPGRIKRGLRANIEMRPPLMAGATYTLVVDAGWRNSEGIATKERYTKTFSCYAADREIPAVSKWTMVQPTSSNSPLVLKFHESFDVALLEYAIAVKNSLGNYVEGNLSVSENESTISFMPARPWSNEKYTVLVNPKLEDLAGNNLMRLFDTDVSEQKNEAPLRNEFTFVVTSKGK